MKPTRETLVDTAKQLLWDIGFEAMSPRKILDRSGAGQGSLYHHFSGKQDLAATALDEMRAEMCDKVDAVFDKAIPPMARMRAYLTAARDGVKGCRLGRLANETALSDDALRDPIDRYFRHVENRVLETLQEAAANGEIRTDSLPLPDVAALIVASVQGGYVLSRVQQDPDRVRHATAGALRLLESLQTTP